jgi:NAD(P)H-dependent FMN reductase
MSTPRILAFSGSLRAGSFNQKLVTLAADFARAAGAEVTLISLRDYRMPLFDQDLETEEGMPLPAQELKSLFAAHDGLITPALKNSIDWVSRATSEDEPPLSVLKGKTAAILAASPGGYGGARSLGFLRPFLENIGITVLPDQVTVPKAHEAFTDDGKLIDAGQVDAVRLLAESLVKQLS